MVLQRATANGSLLHSRQPAWQLGEVGATQAVGWPGAAIISEMGVKKRGEGNPSSR
jgi:hypothetical protein